MSSTGRVVASVDLITDTEQIGELAELAVRLGIDIVDIRASHKTGKRIHFESANEQWLRDVIAQLLLLEALAHGTSVELVIEDVKAKLANHMHPISVTPKRGVTPEGWGQPGE